MIAKLTAGLSALAISIAAPLSAEAHPNKGYRHTHHHYGHVHRHNHRGGSLCEKRKWVEEYVPPTRRHTGYWRRSKQTVLVGCKGRRHTHAVGYNHHAHRPHGGVHDHSHRHGYKGRKGRDTVDTKIRLNINLAN